MLKLGCYNHLEILRTTSVGLYLGDGEGNDVLLPNKYIKPGFIVGKTIEVFVYKDYEHRWIATTLRPYFQLHQFASLKVKAVSDKGAFLDWGLEKDLFVPYREQNLKMKEGNRYIVFLYIDDQTDRLVASAKLNKFLDEDTWSLEPNQAMQGLVFESTPLGWNIILDHRYKGLVYHTDLRRTLKLGERLTVYIKQIREDGGIDLSMEPLGVQRLEEGAQKILDILETSKKAYLKLNDKSSPDEIQQMLDMSKKTFKSSIGILYKMKKIEIREDGIYLLR